MEITKYHKVTRDKKKKEEYSPSGNLGAGE
jgi:hypothetical protein